MQYLEESFRILRANLEARYAGQALVSITSARRNDGCSYVAAGLARAFAEAGRSTLLIAASGERTGAAPLDGVVRNANLDTWSFALPSGADPAARDVEARLPEFRARYRAIVVDCAPVVEDAAACEFARRADAVLLAVRLGRRIVPADREAMRLLEAFGSNVVGVVPTRGRALAAPQAAPERRRAEIVEYEPKPRVTAIRQAEAGQ
jgi:Mrp family chromosome partitioning ATPase